MGALLVCPECSHEWNPEDTWDDEGGAGAANEGVISDAVGNVLADDVADHDIDCKVDGFGQMQLKSSLVKKVL